MKVTVDTKELITALELHNPNADLTGVKAYLFDLVVGTTVTTAGVVSKPAPAPVLSAPAPKAQSRVTQEVKRAAEAAQAFNEDDYVSEAHLIAQEPTLPLDVEGAFEDDDALGVLAKDMAEQPKRSSIRERKAQREAKRKETEDLSKLSGKEIMERLTSKAMPKKKEGHNQFVDMGSDEAGGDDIDVLG